MTREIVEFSRFVRAAGAGFWLLIILLQGSQIAVQRTLQNQPVEPLKIVAWMSGWVIWALLTPLVVGFARRWPLGPPHMRAAVMRHMGLAAVVALAHIAAESFLRLTVWVPVLGERSPRDTLVSLFAYRFHINMLIYWAIVGAHLAVQNHLKYREQEVVASRLESQLRFAQLQRLKAQLHPHFLFNTLHSIHALMRKGQVEKATGMLTHLSDFLRMTMESHSEQLVTLQQELEHLEPYLEIQRIRFADRLTVETDVDPQTLSADVPDMILQPLVENAIEHGLAPTTRKGMVTLEADREGSRLVLRIRDNGRGLEDLGRVHEGVGLSNTRARLRQLYGTDQNVELSTRTNCGTTVTLTTPFRVSRPGAGS